ncbi:MAG: CBS domain-containing protein [Halodesulfurarchaeum sp.]
METKDKIRVSDVMTTPLVTVRESATVSEAAELMAEEELSSLLVPGAEMGIVTSTDVLRAVADGVDPTTTHVEDVMTRPVERVATDLYLGEAAAMMTNYGIKHLPVIDEDGDYVGMVSSSDITAAMA